MHTVTLTGEMGHGYRVLAVLEMYVNHKTGIYIYTSLQTTTQSLCFMRLQIYIIHVCNVRNYANLNVI